VKSPLRSMMSGGTKPTRRATSVARAGAAAVWIALASSACTTFPDVSAVIDLRILAVQTDPPDVFLKVTGLPTDPSMPVDPLALGIDPTSIPVIEVKPLLADPPAAADGRSVTWRLSACPNNPYGPTPPGSVMSGGATDPGGGANNTVGSTLCDGARVVLPPIPGTFADGASAPVQLTPDELLTAFKADVYLDRVGQPHGGFDLGMPLNLQLTVTDGVQTAIAVKRVLFWAQTWPDQQLNQIPTMTSVSLFAHRDAATFALLEPAGPLDATKPAHVALADGVWLRPEGVVAESYRPTVINRDPPYQAIEGVPVEERIRYAFYATTGHFDPARTANQLTPGAVGTVHIESHYVPPATVDTVPIDAASGSHLVTVWIVVRDDRGGESWIEGHLALDP
jgi:hypothetical protein